MILCMKKLFPIFVLFLLFLTVSFFTGSNTAEAKVFLPNAAGSNSQWTGAYGDVDEYLTNDGDTTYNYTSAAAIQSYNLENSSDSGTIDSVTVVLYAKFSGTQENLYPMLRTGAVNYDAASACSGLDTASYKKCSYSWSLNPATSNAWTVSDISSLEAGFKTVMLGGAWENAEYRVSQMYLDVAFRAETKKTKYHILQRLAVLSVPLDQSFEFSIADPLDEVRSAFIEIKGVSIPIASFTLGVTVDNDPNTPGSYDATYTINATGRPTSFKIIHDVTDHFKSSVRTSGGYTRYIHLNPSANIYLVNAKLTITYTWIIPPPAGSAGATGTLTSVAFDTTASADGPAYNSIMWKGSLNGGTGKVRFQLATSGSSSGPWNFIGGDTCASGDWYSPSGPNSPIEISCAAQNHNNQRYFKYKIQLCSNSDCATAGSTSPTVNDVVVSWSP